MITLFYGTQVFAQYPDKKAMSKDIYPHTEVQSEVYNGGFAYMGDERKWYRCDLTPCLIEDVPKHFQMLALVLNL